MKKNLNNVDTKNQTKKIKTLIDYFETNHPNLNKKENILNIQKRPNLAPLNDKIEVNKNTNNNNIEIKTNFTNKNISEFINEKEQEENVENEIKKENKNKENNSLNEILEIDEQKINEKLSELKTNIVSILSNSVNSISSKFESFIDTMINWYKTQNQKISISSKEINQKINTRKIKMNEKISIIFKILNNLNSSIHSQITLLDLFLNGNFFDINFPLEEFIVKNSDLMINGNFLSKIDINSLYMNKIFENKDLTEIFKNYYLKRKSNYSKIKNIKIKIKNINELIATNNKIHELKGDEKNFTNKVNSITFDSLNLASFPLERVFINNLKHLEKFKIKKCTNLYNTNIYKSIINNAVDLKIIKLEGIQLTDKSLNEFFLNITKINSLQKSIN